MENRKKFRFCKKQLALIAMIVCCVAILAAGTLAYFTAEETNYNVITTAALSIDLIEEMENGKLWPEDGVMGVLPGMDVTKIPYVVNNGSADAYIRIWLDKSIVPGKYPDAVLNFDNITFDIDTENWTEQDGFYYYNKPLASGEQTEPLFTKVHFDGSLGNEYMDAKAIVKVIAQAVQVKHNGDSALTAAGWPAVD